MRKRLLIALMACNVGMLTFTLPGRSQADEEPADGLKACCKKSVEGVPFCCSDCCLLTGNCKRDAQCT